VTRRYVVRQVVGTPARPAPQAVMRQVRPAVAVAGAATGGAAAGGGSAPDPAAVLERLSEEHHRLVARLRRELRAARRERQTLVQRLEAVERRLEEVATAPPRGAAAAGARSAQAAGLVSRRQEVLGRAGRGEAARDIASALGHGVGEVDLMLRLAGRRTLGAPAEGPAAQGDQP
jgi:hypothetical protein